MRNCFLVVIFLETGEYDTGNASCPLRRSRSTSSSAGSTMVGSLEKNGLVLGEGERVRRNGKIGIVYCVFWSYISLPQIQIDRLRK